MMQIRGGAVCDVPYLWLQVANELMARIHDPSVVLQHEESHNESNYANRPAQHLAQHSNRLPQGRTQTGFLQSCPPKTSATKLAVRAGLELCNWMEEICALKSAATIKPLTRYERTQLKTLIGEVEQRKNFLQAYPQ
jgi:hypothetical protein